MLITINDDSYTPYSDKRMIRQTHACLKSLCCYSLPQTLLCAVRCTARCSRTWPFARCQVAQARGAVIRPACMPCNAATPSPAS